jgi:hypothetical protein
MGFSFRDTCPCLGNGLSLHVRSQPDGVLELLDNITAASPEPTRRHAYLYEKLRPLLRKAGTRCPRP